MGTPQLFEIYPAILDAVTLNQLDSVEPSPGVEELIAMAGGAIDPQVIAMAFAEPTLKISSRDLASVLAGVSPATGLAVSSQAKFQYERRLSGGIYQGDGNHVTLTSTLGQAWIEEFGCDQDAKEGADVSLSYAALYDGTNLPLVVNTGANLSGTPAANAVHALGPVVLEGAQLPGVTKVRVKTGNQYRVKRADGDLFARVGSIVKRGFTIEIECLNLTALATLGAFKYALSSGITCYFQKAVPGGGRVAYGTSQHISVNVTAGTYTIAGISGSKGEDALTRITVMAAGSTSVAISTTAAIVIP